jgi:hypothetical protein
MMGMRAAMLGASLFLVSAAQDEKKPNTPTDQYEIRTVEGWTVRVNRTLLGEQSELGDRALRLLGIKLFEIGRVVPAKALDELKKVPLWIGIDDYIEKRACYHPSAAWLRDHGLNPEKAKAVELGCAADFVKESIHQPWMVLHELAHAYHDRVLGFDHAEILAAYAKAKEAGTYESVLRISGKREKAYAITRPQEYFAEACEAYFGTNDFYPFVRAELHEHDPALFEILKKVWNR